MLCVNQIVSLLFCFFCNKDRSDSAAATAATLAHEMGHNFGFIHDQDGKCIDKNLGVLIYFVVHYTLQPKQCEIKM